jgi:hypothetical protein
MSTSFRAGVMLSALVGLPAAWVYYGPLPPHAQRVVDRFVAAAKEATGWDRTTPSRDEAPAAEAPAFVIGDHASVVEAPHFSSAPAPLTSAIHAVPSSGNNAGADGLTVKPGIEPLLQRLRQLGAAHYVLEPWGVEQKLFRFRCEMPLADSDTMTQQFEAIAADPAASVEQVVAEVSSWQVARVGTAVLR